MAKIRRQMSFSGAGMTVLDSAFPTCPESDLRAIETAIGLGNVRLSC